MKLVRITLSAVATICLLAAKPAPAQETCGNKCPGGPSSCKACAGANPFSPYSGSVQREITDLELFNGVGEERLAFKRLTTSRYKPGIPTPLGTGGSWRHNYYWNIIPAGTDSVSQSEIIHIDYPDATEHDFHKETSSSTYLTAVSSTQERVEQFATNQYYLWFPDGRHLEFKKVFDANNTPSFQIVAWYDKYSYRYDFHFDGKNRLDQVTEPGGRFIKITYGYIGNFNTVSTTFVLNPNSRTDLTITSATVLGDFNGWGSNPSGNVMTKGADGIWRATVQVQSKTAYQYKFLVNGNTWISDPINPDTVPAGGPSTNNNSVVTVNNADSGTTADAVPVTFTYTSSTATSVSVAGGFNGWRTDANQMTRSGNTWTTTIPLTNAIYDYKFVVNGSTWIQDPSNPYRDPDGYGGYNSRLAVGPYDEAITHVETNDGRAVNYSYSMYGVEGTLYSILYQASYGDGTSAAYTYNAPSIGSRPTLATADDPRYKGPMTRVAYTYQNNGIEGFVATEAAMGDGTIVASLTPSDTADRYVTTAGSQSHAIFSNGNLSDQYDSLGRQKHYEYFNSGWGMLLSLTEYNDNGDPPYITTYERTAEFGNISKVTLPDGKTRITQYQDVNKPFYPAYTIDENGNKTTYTQRDSQNRPLRIDYPTPAGSAPIYETFTYTTYTSPPPNSRSVSMLTAHRMRNGATETFDYYIGDSAGRLGDLKTKTDGASHTTTYVWNAAGQKVSETDDTQPTANVTQYDYHERGTLKKKTFADGSAQQFEYDTYGNRTVITNERSKQWVYSYDPYNRISDVTEPHAADGRNHTIHYAYDLPTSGGCGMCTIDTYPTSITLPSGQKTIIGYDAEWQKTSVTLGANDNAEASITSYAYDAVGNLKSITDGRGKVWSYMYDSRHRRTRSSTPPTAGAYIGTYTDYTYDGVGHRTTEKRADDPLPTVYTYDAGDRLTQVTDAKGQTRRMTYDTANNLLTIQDPRTDQGGANTYTYEYADGMNRKTKLTYPDGTTETWTYDNAGSVSSYKTRANQTETMQVDKRHREIGTSWTNSSAPATSKDYYANGLLWHFNSGTTTSLTYEYDDADRMTKETQDISGAGAARAVVYTYDVDGNRTNFSYPSGESASFTYTSRRQLKSVTSGAISAAYSYDGNGNRLSNTFGSGVTTAYSYDEANRLLTLDTLTGVASVANYDYAYNTLNNRTSRTETVNGAAKTDAYSYDAIDQLTQVKYNLNSTANTQERLVSYDYDAAGNRADRNGIAAVSDSVSGSASYIANASNQYTVAGTFSPSYDVNGSGSLTGQSGWTYTYDALNRLVSATGNGTTAVLAYDGRNRCVSRTLNGVTMYFYYDGWNIIEERSTTDLLARYVTGPVVDEVVARLSGAGAVIGYYHYDGLGSVTSLTSATGAVLERYTYDVFGAPTFRDAAGAVVSTSQTANRFLFSGREYIAQLGLYDYRNRAYLPNLGRFMQLDPLRFDAKDVNLYRYVRNSPAQWVDPDGLVGKSHPVCDGNGGFMMDLGSNAGSVVESCIKDHEQSHIDDYKRDYPDICKGKPKGSPIYPGNKEWLRQSECKAYAGEKQCDEKKARQCRLSGNEGAASEAEHAKTQAENEMMSRKCGG